MLLSFNRPIPSENKIGEARTSILSKPRQTLIAKSDVWCLLDFASPNQFTEKLLTVVILLKSVLKLDSSKKY